MALNAPTLRSGREAGRLAGLRSPAAGLALLYAVPELQLVHRLATLAAVFIPFGVLLWGAAVLLFLAAGRGWGKLLALVAVAGLVLAVLWARAFARPLPEKGSFFSAQLHPKWGARRQEGEGRS